MNQTHLHLLINHLPVFGSVLGGIVLAHGLWTKSNPTKIAAYNLLIISSIGAVIAYLTGEPAEETVENIQGISKAMLEEHEDAADYALGAMIAAGVASLIGLFVTIRNISFNNTIAWITFFISLFSFTVLARTAWLGGQIRHTEINSSVTVQQGTEHGHED